MQNTALTIFQRMKKQPPFFSKFYPIYDKERKLFKHLSGYYYKFPIKQVYQYDKNRNRQHLYKSDFGFRPIHKFLCVTISSKKYMKNSNSDLISLLVYNNSFYIYIISNEKRNTDYFTKTTYFKPTFKISLYTEQQQKFLTMFNTLK